MNSQPLWITDNDALTRVLAEVGDGPLSFDLEADSFHHYRDQVCLVQMSFAERHYLVDPLVGADLRRFGPVLADPGIPKLLHGSDYDLRLLHRDYGLEIRGLFDTMVAARLVGERAFGLAALLERHLDVRLDKRFQRADWSRRPLGEDMVAYAVEDTRHLARLVEILGGRLRELGRKAWAEEEFGRLETVRWTRDVDADDAFRRVKGCARLDRRALTIVRQLYLFRDARARERDVPPFRVFPDESIVALARAAPGEVSDLAIIPRLPRAYRGGDGARRLLDAVERGREAPVVEATPRRGERKRATPEAEENAARLRGARDAEAARLGIESSVLATRKTLDAIAECVVAERPWRDVEGLRAWQADILAPLIDSSL